MNYWHIYVTIPTIAKILELTHNTVAIPYGNRVLFPVNVVPEKRRVTPDPWVIVWLAEESLNIVTASPTENTLEGTVTPPVVIDMCLPASDICRE